MTHSVWEDIRQVRPHVSRVLLYGPPGTGKTTLGFSDDKETFYVPLHEEVSPAELLGHFVPAGNRFVWFDGPVLMAWQRGARLILDELDQAGGSVMSVLRAILNDPEIARLTLPDPSLAELDDETLGAVIAAGEGFRTIKPAEGFQVFATMNGDPSDLDAPLLDRFEATFYVGETNPQAIDSLPDDLQNAARSTATDDMSRRIGLRRWKAFAALREEVGEATAARAVFGNRHGDVLDALRLSRPSEADKPVEIEPVTSDDDELPDEYRARVEPEAKPVAIGRTEDSPTIYLVKTGKRGRPPLAMCPEHGKMTHRNCHITGDGDLCCRKCGHTVALRGTYNARYLDKGTGKWITES
jgi:DNA polymerase III delta prime subunit